MPRLFLHTTITLLAVSAAPALADPPATGSLIAALSGDWNGNEQLDAVILTRAEDGMADLTVYRGGGIHGLEPVLTLPAAIFAGPMAGQAPSLVPVSDSSFAILTEQTGVGRTPWHQRVTVAWRDGAFVVAGFTYDFYDRLDLGHYGQCDLNLLTGAYRITVSRGDTQPDGTMLEGSAVEEHRSGRLPPTAFALEDYTQDFWPETCQGLLN